MYILCTHRACYCGERSNYSRNYRLTACVCFHGVRHVRYRHEYILVVYLFTPGPYKPEYETNKLLGATKYHWASLVQERKRKAG